MLKIILKSFALILLLLTAHAASFYWNWFGEHQGPGQVNEHALPTAAIDDKQLRLQAAGASKQILFGDLHAHTTFSKDAFLMSLPLLGGAGAHPPADACDFARYCSGLDFFGIADHAESLTPQQWRETKDAVRQCNAVASNSNNPDLVAFLGWEWSQIGKTPDTHYGHKNVFFKDTEEGQVPSRPIGTGAPGLPDMTITGINVGLSLLDYSNRQYYYDLQNSLVEHRETPICESGIASHLLPENCIEIAKTGEELNRKLDEWGFESLVIPHGTSWGLTSPLGADFATQLNRKSHNPERQNMIEVFSGHGNSEEYRPWREVAYTDDGRARCPQTTDKHLPGCKRAGEIIYSRCQAAGLDSTECQQRQLQAEQNYIDAGLQKGFMTVPGANAQDWGWADQCKDCFLPAFNYIPRGSAQYALALSNFDEADEDKKPLRFRFGLMGSSDNHAAKAGTGYKEFDRNLMSESRTPQTPLLNPVLRPDRGDAVLESIPAKALSTGAALDRERYASFTLTGGIIAVHSESRHRDDIWTAMQQREVYATSGPQILLWFDLLTDDSQEATNHPMGSELETTNNPHFRVRAAGSFKQKPGCPGFVRNALGEQRTQSLCQGECFNPDDERYQLSRIEVVRIRPQSYPNEPIDHLIEDPWRTFACPPSSDACEITFKDDDFSTSKRDTLYYVRAIQEPTEMVNGDPFKCLATGNQGQCIEYQQCDPTDPNDHCLGMNEERAWSSPIFVDYQR